MEQEPEKLQYPRVKLKRENETLDNFVDAPMRATYLNTTTGSDSVLKQSARMAHSSLEPMKIKQVEASEKSLQLAPSEQ